MEHRKIEHVNYISECRENKNGWCRFSDKECWFKHSDITSNNERENSGIQTSEIMNRIFDMMEAFADRMTKVENQI